MHSLLRFDSILRLDKFDVAKSVAASVCGVRRMDKPAYPLERPVALSVITRTPDSSPNDSNSLVSQSSSTFQERLPTNRFFLEASSPTASVLGFFAIGTASASALRFLGAGVSSSALSSSEESSSDPDPDSSLSDSSSDDA